MSVPAAAPPPLRDPYEIFARARAYWESAAYPKAAAYTIAVRVTKNGTASQAHYHARYDAADDAVQIDPTSDEERAHPYTPHGINTVLNLFSGFIPLSAPQQTFDYLGVPKLAPNYSFGIARYVPHADTIDSAALVAEIRRQFPDPEHHHKRATPAGPLRTIASVVVVHRHYTMTLDGIEPIDGHPDYHISSSPCRTHSNTACAKSGSTTRPLQLTALSPRATSPIPNSRRPAGKSPSNKSPARRTSLRNPHLRRSASTAATTIPQRSLSRTSPPPARTASWAPHFSRQTRTRHRWF